jgi:hypothetical protein
MRLGVMSEVVRLGQAVRGVDGDSRLRAQRGPNPADAQICHREDALDFKDRFGGRIDRARFDGIHKSGTDLTDSRAKDAETGDRDNEADDGIGLFPAHARSRRRVGEAGRWARIANCCN